MSGWTSKPWVACAVTSCENEALRTKAEGLGWLIREGRKPLCPVHRGDVRTLDAAERAAGEQGEK